MNSQGSSGFVRIGRLVSACGVAFVATAAASGTVQGSEAFANTTPEPLAATGAVSSSDVVVTLDSADTLRGMLVRQDARVVVIDHPVLGRLTLDRARVLDVHAAALSEPGAAPAVFGSGSIASPIVVAPAATVVLTLAPTQDPDADAESELGPAEPSSFWEGWVGRVDMGLSGSEGNTTTLNLRAELGLERMTSTMETRFGALYRLTRDDNENTENRFQFDGRNDWIIPDEPWRYFVRGRAEFDEFQPWDTRFTLFGGVGYDLIRSDETTLTLLAGLGGNYTYGGTTYDLTPEAMFAVDFRHKLTRRSSITVYSEFLPSLKNASDFRWNTLAAYEVLLDEDLNLVLRAGIDNRYDSNVDSGFKRNDLDYFITLGFRF